jgi:hypothetical protein
MAQASTEEDVACTPHPPFTDGSTAGLRARLGRGGGAWGLVATGAHSAAVEGAASATGSGRSSSSTKAIGALSPTRKPIFRMRV